MLTHVRVSASTLSLPTYLIGPEDPNPPFQRSGFWSVYPYTLLDDIRTECRVVAHRAIVLENEYTRVTVLPDLGGRVHSLFDKVAGREALYCNDAIKPGLVAMRGAWLAGGLEFNFPAGHHCNTVSPVSCVTTTSDDGSATCWVGTLDLVTRMRWSVGISLSPGSSCVRTEVRIDNRTPLRGPLYFWENAAVYAPEDLQLVFPAREALLAGGHERVSYPTAADGRDVSLYRNHPVANDIFCLGVEEDFFGAYYPAWGTGVVHCADHRKVVGKKFFTWGTADSGLIWADILSDAAGPYCEIQGGRFATQSIWGFVPPARALRWDQVWWPVHGIGRFHWATRDAALALEPRDGSVRIGVCASRPIAQGRVVLLDGARPLWEWTGGLAPETPLRANLAVEQTNGELALRVEDAGTLLLEYAHNGEPAYDRNAADRAARRLPLEAERTPEELLESAQAAEKQGSYAEARRLYEKVLPANPECAQAHLGLAVLDLRAAKWAEAAQHAGAFLAVDPEHGEGHYYLGIALMRLGDRASAETELRNALGCPVAGAAAAIALSQLLTTQGRDAQALDVLHTAIGCEADLTGRAAVLAGALARRAQPAVDAAPSTGKAANPSSPTDTPAAIESWLATRTPEAESAVLQCSRGRPEEYLECAWEYMALGAYEDARRVLELGIAHGPGAPEPLCADNARDVHAMLRYTLAYTLDRLGLAREADDELKRASACSTHGVFPHRTEELAVLRWAAEQQPLDAHARLLLGNLLLHQAQREDALRSLHAAVELDPSLAVAHRNLGLLAWQDGDLAAASDHYSRALAANPDDYRYYRDLDDIERARRAPLSERLARLDSAPAPAREQQEVVWRRVVLLTAVGEYDSAVGLLQRHTFRPWEGAVAMRHVYTEAYLARGRARLAAGDLAGARADFEQALLYPRNIGVGKPPNPHDAKVLYWASCARAQAGDDAAARAALVEAAAESHGPATEGRYWQIRCIEAMGEAEEADKAARALMETAKSLRDSRPSSAEASLVLGLAHRLVRDTDGAAVEFARALELDPQLTEARLQLAGL